MKHLNHAYLLNLSHVPSDTYDSALLLISSERQKYVETFEDSLHRAQALYSTLLLEFALEKAGLSPDLLIFDEENRPVLPSGKGFASSSCSGNLAACALSQDPVGIDIQKHQGADPAIARHFLHPDEQSYLFSLSQEEQNSMFYSLWCRKECYVKAEGLDDDPTTVSSLSPAQDKIYYDFSFPGYSAAVYGSIEHCPYQIEKVPLNFWVKTLNRG